MLALRARRRPPCLRGWVLELYGGDRFVIDAAQHDPQARLAGGEDLIGLAPSAALGIDRLPAAEAAELAEAWLDAAPAAGTAVRRLGHRGHPRA